MSRRKTYKSTIEIMTTKTGNISYHHFTLTDDSDDYFRTLNLEIGNKREETIKKIKKDHENYIQKNSKSAQAITTITIETKIE
ncbi:hypothetical protein KAT80_01715 [Candidatus Pacearchaeota archaeon]|nr:hypothetical protein [Candidatus Pacearchaeota archaeon]